MSGGFGGGGMSGSSANAGAMSGGFGGGSFANAQAGASSWGKKLLSVTEGSKADTTRSSRKLLLK